MVPQGTIRMTPPQRIEVILNAFNMNAKAFAESIGLDRPDRIYYVQNGRNGISQELAEKITARYNMISYMWLITGEGEAFNYEVNERVMNEVAEVLNEKKLTPVQLAEMVGMQFAGEIMDAVKGIPPSAELLKKVRQISKRKGVPVLGYADIKGSIEDSIDIHMGDLYTLPIAGVDCILISPSTLNMRDIKTGDLLAIRRVTETFHQINRVHVLDTEQGIIVCEIKGEQEGVYSVRTDEGEYSVPATAIHCKYIVVSTLRPK